MGELVVCKLAEDVVAAADYGWVLHIVLCELVKVFFFLGVGVNIIRADKKKQDVFRWGGN